MKVPANDDSGDAKPGHKNPGDEFVRAHRGQRRVKTDKNDAVESEPGADFGFVPGRRQPERDRPGGEKVRRMRLEGQDRAWRRSLASKGDRALDDRLMAKMQAIEISDRVNRAFKPSGGAMGSVARTKSLVISSCRCRLPADLSPRFAGPGFDVADPVMARDASIWASAER